MRFLAKLLFQNLMGWRLLGEIDRSIEKCVIIVVPHTSSQDFIMGLLIRSLLGIRINYLGKKELFAWPLGFYFRWTGGAPLDRTPGQNKVESIATLFNSTKPSGWLCLQREPEKKWASGKQGFITLPLRPMFRSFQLPWITVKKKFVWARYSSLLGTSAMTCLF